jgi:hypothetical protein
MSPDGKTHNQIDRILVDRRRHSNVLDVQSFREADCDSDHYLVVARKELLSLQYGLESTGLSSTPALTIQVLISFLRKHPGTFLL